MIAVKFAPMLRDEKRLRRKEKKREMTVSLGRGEEGEGERREKCMERGDGNLE